MPDYIRVPLSKGKFALIDAEDADRVLAFKWQAHLANPGCPTPKWYARRRTKIGGKYRVIRLHRFIVDAPDGTEVDHINGDGLDCRRENLRFATDFQQCANRTKNGNAHVTQYKGVEQCGKKWRVRFVANGVRYNVGTFDTEESAAHEYDRLARLIHGEFAWLNFDTRTRTSEMEAA